MPLPIGFGGLQASLRSLQQTQRKLEITSRNITGANDPGYTREQLTAADQIGFPDVARDRDVLLDRNFRQRSGDQGYAAAQRSQVGAVEGLFAEPSTQGISAALDAFWVAAQALSNNPADAGVRLTFQQSATTVAARITSVSDGLQTARNHADQAVAANVDQVNSLLADVADINHRVVGEQVAGRETALLQDRRDRDIDQLSKLVGANASINNDGTVSVWAGNNTLVSGVFYEQIVATSGAGGMQTLTWKNAGIPAGQDGGELKGLLEARDQTIPRYQGYLTALAGAVASQVNAQQQAGYDQDGNPGQALFINPPGTGVLQPGPALTGSPRLIAAAATNNPVNPLDGKNAQAMAALRTQATAISGAADLTGGNSMPLSNFYQQLIAQLGAESKGAKQIAETADAMASQANQMRLSAEGVEPDAEALRLTALQKAYTAAARTISAYNETLNTLITQLAPGR